VYPDSQWKQTLVYCDTHDFALTGSIIAQDREAIAEATSVLEDAAGEAHIERARVQQICTKIGKSVTFQHTSSPPNC
jgi:hypothetical protein